MTYPVVSLSSLRVSSRDTGKTMVDASLGEIMTTCEKITWLLSEGEKWLKPEYRYFPPAFEYYFSFLNVLSVSFVLESLKMNALV